VEMKLVAKMSDVHYDSWGDVPDRRCWHQNQNVDTTPSSSLRSMMTVAWRKASAHLCTFLPFSLP
jgi:hypothetical protein